MNPAGRNRNLYKELRHEEGESPLGLPDDASSLELLGGIIRLLEAKVIIPLSG